MKWYEWTALGGAALGLGWAATRRRKKTGKTNGQAEPWDDDTLVVPEPQFAPVAIADVGTDVWVKLPADTWQVETVDTIAGAECVAVADMQTRPGAVYVLVRPVLGECRTTVRFHGASGQTLAAVIDTGFVPA